MPESFECLLRECLCYECMHERLDNALMQIKSAMYSITAQYMPDTLLQQQQQHLHTPLFALFRTTYAKESPRMPEYTGQSGQSEIVHYLIDNVEVADKQNVMLKSKSWT